MLLPTVSGQSAAGCKWKNCCRRSWEMLMAPVSPKNLRTTALLTGIYQLVSSNIYINSSGLYKIRSGEWISQAGRSALARREIRESPSNPQCAAAAPNTKITHWICKAIPHWARKEASKAAMERSPPPIPGEVQGRSEGDAPAAQCVRT